MMDKDSNQIIAVLIDRDGCSELEAIELLEYARAELDEGGDPEEILLDNFGLEMDYIFDLID